MLIPQYSIRWLLGMMAVSAIVFSIFAVALSGSYWAIGVTMGILSLVAVFVVHFALFSLVGTVAPMLDRRRRSRPCVNEPASVPETRE